MNNLLRLIGRRLVALPIMALGVTVLVFFLMSFSKTDPAYTALGDGASPEAVAEYHEKYGLDDPWPVRYVRYMGDLIHGDMGTYGAARICIRTGNACILRGGSLAYHSCAMIAELLADALEPQGFPREAVSMIESTDREATGELMKLRGIVDVLIPRGGAGLIQRCVRESLVPVIETGTGNCHIYVHESADFDKALNIIVNAKTQRVGVCNAAESLLVDRAVADSFLPAVVAVLHDHGVLIHGDEATCAACAAAGLAEGDDYVAATEEDWGREYLALEMSVKVVANEDEAIAHINRYGTMHSEAIVAEDEDACERFLDAVDASAVYANASTRFTDGGEFGLGAEIGISTQKLHARGPFAAEALTTYKYKLRGTGQVRP